MEKPKNEKFEVQKINESSLTAKEFREKIMLAEAKMRQDPKSLEGEKLDEYCPLVHSFGKDLYVREIFAPAKTLIITKIHKFDHPFFVLKGKALVADENGVVLIEAPYYGMTKAGTKRAVYTIDDVTWVTVHATKSHDLKEIEDEIIAKDFNDLDIIDIDKDNVKEVEA